MKLEIKDLWISVNGKQIIKGLNLDINKGEIHALMGPNGSGKSTLANALLGHPKYKIENGEILLDGIDLLKLKPEERAKKGLFLAFQYPLEISGVKFSNFLFSVMKKYDHELNIVKFKQKLNETLKKLNLDENFPNRELNYGFSGGEKKRAEILQLLMINPQLAILDETDSGLDIDSLKLVAKAVNNLRNPNFSCLVITHYQRVLNYLKPDVVHIMVDGNIVLTGDYELVNEIESKGYENIKELV